MNPMLLLLNQLQTQVKATNPQMFNQFQNLMKNQSNPQEVLNNVMSKYNAEQIQQFKKFANSFGITNEQLNKYDIGTK